MTTRLRTVGSSVGFLMWGLANARLLACPICFQIDDAPTTAGIRAAVTVLVATMAVVFAGFGVFVARFVKRTRGVSTDEAPPTS